jgi:hypothetical protein
MMGTNGYERDTLQLQSMKHASIIAQPLMLCFSSFLPSLSSVCLRRSFVATSLILL